MAVKTRRQTRPLTEGLLRHLLSNPLAALAALHTALVSESEWERVAMGALVAVVGKVRY